VLYQQADCAFKLCQESPRKANSCFALVKADGLRKVFSGKPIDAAIH
jgi:hypothetical protein